MYSAANNIPGNPASKTIFLFGYYPLLAGLSMVLAPAMPLEIMGLPVEGLDWIRMLGVVTMIVGYYYLNNGRLGVIQFARFTVHARTLIPFVFLAMVLVFDMSPIYIAFTAVDVLGGLWTWSALKKMNVPVWGEWTDAQ